MSKQAESIACSALPGLPCPNKEEAMIILEISAKDLKFRSDKPINPSPALRKTLALSIIRFIATAFGEAGIDEKTCTEFQRYICNLFISVMANTPVSGVKLLSGTYNVVFQEENGKYNAGVLSDDKNSKDSNLDILICTLLGLFQGLVGDIDSVFFNNDMADEFDRVYKSAKAKGVADA